MRTAVAGRFAGTLKEIRWILDFLIEKIETLWHFSHFYAEHMKQATARPDSGVAGRPQILTRGIVSSPRQDSAAAGTGAGPGNSQRRRRQATISCGGIGRAM